MWFNVALALLDNVSQATTIDRRPTGYSNDLTAHAHNAPSAQVPPTSSSSPPVSDDCCLTPASLTISGGGIVFSGRPFGCQFVRCPSVRWHLFRLARYVLTSLLPQIFNMRVGNGQWAEKKFQRFQRSKVKVICVQMCDCYIVGCTHFDYMRFGTRNVTYSTTALLGAETRERNVTLNGTVV